MFSGVEKKKKTKQIDGKVQPFHLLPEKQKFLRFNIKWTLVPFGGVRGGGSQNQ